MQLGVVTADNAILLVCNTQLFVIYWGHLFNLTIAPDDSSPQIRRQKSGVRRQQSRNNYQAGATAASKAAAPKPKANNTPKIIVSILGFLCPFLSTLKFRIEVFKNTAHSLFNAPISRSLLRREPERPPPHSRYRSPRQQWVHPSPSSPTRSRWTTSLSTWKRAKETPATAEQRSQ